jgi:hypothetical protein
MTPRPVNPLSAHFQGEIAEPKFGWFPVGDECRREDPPTPATEYVIGVDLGQSQDYSALCVIEYQNVDEPTYHVRHLHRWPLGTPYTQIVRDVEAMVRTPPLDTRHPAVAADRTGVGRGVLEMFGDGLAADLHAILITAGHSVTRDAEGCWHVPKVELVSALQKLLQSRRLKVSPDLDMAAVLVSELKAFRTKITLSGHETFEAWRERDHDDLVLAVAMAVWLGEHRPRGVLDAYM